MSCNSVIIKEAVDNDPPQKVRNSILSILYYDFSNSKFNIVLIISFKVVYVFHTISVFYVIFLKKSHVLYYERKLPFFIEFMIYFHYKLKQIISVSCHNTFL